MARILFVNRFYWPDETATGQLLTDLAETLARRGREVAVMTSLPPGAGPLPGRRKGVTIERLGSSRLDRPGLSAKFRDFASFWVRSLVRLAQTTRRGDTIVAMTDPPMLGTGAAWIARMRRAACVQWIQDIYPELAVELSGRRSPRLLLPLRDGAWRWSAACVTLGPGMAAVVAASRVDAARLHIIPNWVPFGLGPPAAGAAAEVRAAWGVADRFVVGYSGNLGRVHDLDAVLALATALRNETGIVFALVGTGAGRKAIEAEASRRGLANLQMFPAQPREHLAASLSAADIHLVTLRAGCEKYVLPSKLYGVAAVGRPVLFLGPLDSDAARMVIDGGFGIAIDAGHTAEAASVLRRLGANPVARARMGAAALDFAAQNGVETAADRWERVLDASAARFETRGPAASHYSSS